MGLEQRGRALHTDLYELTMAAAYFEQGITDRAAFELFVRELPPQRSYLVCAGLAQAVSYLRNLRFTGRHIDFLRRLPVFQKVSRRFFDHLAGLSFSGTLEAIPEGRPVFAEEPLLRVEAPIIQAQMVETFLLSMVNYQTLVATKAARVVDAARCDGKERTVVDFGTRRAHGPDAAVLAARAAFIGGCAATSNLEAGHRMGIPVSGTQAHSYIMAFDSEEEAFRSYYQCFGEQTLLLIDTYDVIEGARKAIRTVPRLRGVRIDSGDISALSKQVRALLDDAGLKNATIVASGDLDEYAIARLVREGARVDAFGVGTQLVTGGDVAALGGVYKLVAIEKSGRWMPRVKLSPDKATFPGRKQVYRFSDAPGGRFTHDVIASAEEPCPPGAEPLLRTVMREGALVEPLPALAEVQDFARKQIARLPMRHRDLANPQPYRVEMSAALQQSFQSLASQKEEKAT
jgi:nicotinate phosphoribosyltransferase